MKYQTSQMKPLIGCTGCTKPCQFGGLCAAPDSNHAGVAKRNAELYGCNSSKARK